MINVDTAIKNLYKEFKHCHRPGRILPHRTCEFCLTKEGEEYMLRTPLKELSAGIFYTWSSACEFKAIETEKYFFPRIMELIRWNTNFDVPGGEVVDDCFDWHIYKAIATFDYLSNFSKKEVQAINDFFYALLHHKYHRAQKEEDDYYWLAAEMLEVAITGYDLTRFLQDLEAGGPLEELALQLLVYSDTEGKNNVYYNHEQWIAQGQRKLLLNWAETHFYKK